MERKSKQQGHTAPPGFVSGSITQRNQQRNQPRVSQANLAGDQTTKNCGYSRWPLDCQNKRDFEISQNNIVFLKRNDHVWNRSNLAYITCNPVNLKAALILSDIGLIQVAISVSNPIIQEHINRKRRSRSFHDFLKIKTNREPAVLYPCAALLKSVLIVSWL